MSAKRYPRQVLPDRAPAGSADATFPVRPNRLRDVVAVILLLAATVLPWNLTFGVGVPGSPTLLFVLLAAVTVPAVLAALAPWWGPVRLAAGAPDPRALIRVRFWLSLPYWLVVVGFVGHHLVETVRLGGTGAVPPGIGPGVWLGLAGALLAGQPPITVTTLARNDFRRGYGVGRLLGVASIGLGALAVVYNLFWRLRYLFVTSEPFGGQDAATIASTVLYGAVALAALVLGSRLLLIRAAAARLATTALGVSTVVAGALVWLLPAGRDVDAFHGIAQNTSTAAIGYEGYLAWAGAAALVAPTTLYAVLRISPPAPAVLRGAARHCLALIAVWSFAAAGLRATDFVIAVALDLPRSGFDSAALIVFRLLAGATAVWLTHRLADAAAPAPVVAAFSGLLAVLTAAQLALGVALAPRYAEPAGWAPGAVYGNDLAQQITSTLDVVICLLSCCVAAAALLSGPYLARFRRPRPRTRGARPVEAPTVVTAPPQAAAPTGGLTTERVSAPGAPPVAAGPPRIARVGRDATRLLAAGPSAATTALRIHRPNRGADFKTDTNTGTGTGTDTDFPTDPVPTDPGR